jgi:hypothetical protein
VFHLVARAEFILKLRDELPAGGRELLGVVLGFESARRGPARQYGLEVRVPPSEAGTVVPDLQIPQPQLRGTTGGPGSSGHDVTRGSPGQMPSRAVGVRKINAEFTESKSLPASGAAQIAALPAAEQECCPFSGFRIQLAG